MSHQHPIVINPLKAPKKQAFSDVFRGYKNRLLRQMGTSLIKHNTKFQVHKKYIL